MHVQTTAAMLKKPTKSIEQQRLDALKYAEKLWGPNIGKLSPSPSPSKVLSPSPPLPLPHNSSHSSSVKETTVPTRSSHITPPLPLHPAAAMRIDRKREASTSPSPHTSLEARTTGEPLQESKKPRYGSNSLSSSSSSSYHRAEDTHNSIGDVRSQKVHSTPHNSKRTPVESSNSTSSSNLTATAVAAVDPLVAAREQMKKLNEERARAAGIAAAARLDKRGAGRK